MCERQKINQSYNSNTKIINQEENVNFILQIEMQNQPSDINLQIDRILSSNIREQLLSGIPRQLLQSPVISKTHLKYQPQSSERRSEKRSQFEQDLYEKAQQIFKLKQLLENELANINQIVMENQKLSEVNENLKSELKKIKNDWKVLKKSLVNELKNQKQSLKRFRAEQTSLIKEYMQNSKAKTKSNKLSIFSCNQITEKSSQIMAKQSAKHCHLQVQNSSVSINIEPFKKIINNQKFPSTFIQTQQNFNTFKSTESLQAEVAQLNQTIKQLKIQNVAYLDKIKFLQDATTKQTPSNTNNPQALQQKQLNHQQQSIQRYSSIFMKSIFQQDQNIYQTIRKALFSQQKSIFDQLQEGKYFGKIVSRTKNGNSIEEYKNGFQYQGKFFKNQRHGLGRLLYKNKLIYAGEWKQGKFSGKGIIFYHLNLNVQKIQANFKNGLIEGYGTITFKSGHKFRAQFKNNLILSEGMLLQKYNQNSDHPTQKSTIGKIQFTKDKQNLLENEKILFKSQSGQFLRIN